MEHKIKGVCLIVNNKITSKKEERLIKFLNEVIERDFFEADCLEVDCDICPYNKFKCNSLIYHKDFANKIAIEYLEELNEL